jgi:hypothetical protein
VSFVRFGVDGSDVYIYDDVRGYKICCGCILAKSLPDRTDAELAELRVAPGIDPELWRARWEPDFTTNDLDAMLAHVAEHRAAGHVVPEWVDQALRDEWTDDDLR